MGIDAALHGLDSCVPQGDLFFIGLVDQVGNAAAHVGEGYAEVAQLVAAVHGHGYAQFARLDALGGVGQQGNGLNDAAVDVINEQRHDGDQQGQQQRHQAAEGIELAVEALAAQAEPEGKVIVTAVHVSGIGKAAVFRIGEAIGETVVLAGGADAVQLDGQGRVPFSGQFMEGAVEHFAVQAEDQHAEAFHALVHQVADEVEPILRFQKEAAGIQRFGEGQHLAVGAAHIFHGAVVPGTVIA